MLSWGRLLLLERFVLYTMFIDLTKFFDTVSKEALWAIPAKYSCPSNIINMIRLFHDGMKGHRLSSVDQSDRAI